RRHTRFSRDWSSDVCSSDLDETSLRGCIAISLARHALGGARVRALTPAAMDLLLAAAFEAVGVFNPMTADPDPRRLKDLAGHLKIGRASGRERRSGPEGVEI